MSFSPLETNHTQFLARFKLVPVQFPKRKALFQQESAHYISSPGGIP